MNNKIIVFDTTLRDGEQTPGVNITVPEKLEIARLLDVLGVDIIEAGFPASSRAVADAVSAIADSVSAGVCAMARCMESDVYTAWEAIKFAKAPSINIVMASSDIHLEHKLKMTRGEALRYTAECVRYAASLCPVEFTCEDSSRSDRGFMLELINSALNAGAKTINITDTVGYAVPSEFGELIRFVKSNTSREAVISAHCHNDLGLAVANTLSAVMSGAGQIETTLCGLGERAGNCPLEEVVMAIETRKQYFPFSHGIDTTKLYRTCARVSAITAIPIAVNKAVIGANAFAHTSGIHQHGVIENPLTYEVMAPQSIGKTGSDIILGKLSGRHAFAERAEHLGFELSEDELKLTFEHFRELAEVRKSVTDADLIAIINQIRVVPDVYTLDTFTIQSGNKIRASASITVIRGGVPYVGEGSGVGSVDAVYNAITNIVGKDWSLSSYLINAVTGGVDALGEVTVRVKHAGELHIGRGLSLDVIEASVLAFLNAINRSLAAGVPPDRR
ncbi:MAG: 2-isopropylmalate synthase [Oscillospiraceae bacterium]|nr:2-isopropylmalate synthase [Oscillospiraceae bacterium]